MYQLHARDHLCRWLFVCFATQRQGESYDAFLKRVALAAKKPVSFCRLVPHRDGPTK